jgi:acyl-coenzyme A thioesterase PaaI-like protein
LGEWIEIRPSVLKTGRTLAFAECHVHCGARLIARGNATFRIV